MTFSRLRELLAGIWPGCCRPGSRRKMDGVRLITPDGLYDDDLYDLEQEQRLVLRTLAKRQAGITAGDVITAVNGTAMPGAQTLATRSPGSTPARPSPSL